MVMLWSDFFSLILPEVKMAPNELVAAQLRRAAIDFCAQSEVWTSEIIPVDVVAGTATYGLEVSDTNATAAEVSQLWYNGAILKFIPLGQMRRYSTQWPTDAGVVEGFTQLDEATITLYRRPVVGIAGGITARVVLRPSLNSTGVPDWLGDRHFDTLVNGAKARLFGMVGAPWADEKAATVYSTLFGGGTMAAAQLRASAVGRGQLSAPVGGSVT